MSRQLDPAIFQETVPANTRRTYVSSRFSDPFTVKNIRPAFALNTQRNLRVTVWVTEQQAVADNERPTGLNLFADRGTRDYIVGDGAEGELNIPIRRNFPGGYRIAVEAENINPGNTHTLDVLVELAEDN